MSLLAEHVAEEWLNRRGFFTIRGAKIGTGEIDLLAIRPSGVSLECWHYEVQGSVRPVSYICPAPKDLRVKGTASYSAKRRPEEVMRQAVKEWLFKKFHDPKKKQLRDALCKGEWKFGLVLGNVKFPEEEQVIRKEGIQVVRLADWIKELEPKNRNVVGCVVEAASGSDFIELLWAHKNLNPAQF